MNEKQPSRNKWEPAVVKLLAIILLTGIAVFLFSVSPYFKPTETFPRGVMHLVVDDKDVTNSLPDPVYVENDVVMMSQETAMKFFKNIYVYYDEKYDTAIITAEDKVAKMKIGERSVSINGIEESLKVPATWKTSEVESGDTKVERKSLYIPISSIQTIFDTEIEYNQKVIATTPWGWVRMKVIRVEGKHKLKAYKREFCLTTGVAKDGERLYIFDTEQKESGDYLVVRNERGDIGYYQYGKIQARDIIRMNQGNKVIKYKGIGDNMKYTLAWEYAQNGTPSRSGQTKIDALDIISPTWIEVENASAELSNTISQDYIQWAKSQNYQLWPVVKNDYISKDDLSIIMNDMELREKLIKNIINLALANQFDGINLDFEYMHKEDKHVFSEFVRELSSTLRANGLVSSVDVTVAGGSDSYSLCYDRTAIGKAADYVMLMAYDQYGNWSEKAGPNSSLTWVKSNIEEMLGYEDVSKDKLFVCVPFYSRVWLADKETGEKKEIPDVLIMSQANKYLESNRENATWNEEAGQYYIEIDKEDGSVVKAWIDNEDALKEKIKLINEYDLAGIAVWRWGFEDGNKAWKAIDETMNVF